MRARGVWARPDWISGLVLPTLMSMSLLLAWPVMGASPGSGERLGAISLVLRVDVWATVVGDMRSGGRTS